MFVLVTKKNRF